MSTRLTTPGKYQGLDFKQIVTLDPDYVRWVIQNGHRDGHRTKPFRDWLIAQGWNVKPLSVTYVIKGVNTNADYLQGYLKRVQETKTVTVHGPIYDSSSSSIPPDLMARVGWFIDYVVRWQVFVTRGPDLTTTSGQTVTKFPDSNLESLGVQAVDIFRAATQLQSHTSLNIESLDCLWRLSFAPELKRKPHLTDEIPLPKFDIKVLSRIQGFVDSLKAKIILAPRLSGKSFFGEADLIANDTIIDIKFSKREPWKNNKYWVQVLLYAIIARQIGLPISRVALYSAAQGILKTVSLQGLDLEKIAAAIRP